MRSLARWFLSLILIAGTSSCTAALPRASPELATCARTDVEAITGRPLTLQRLRFGRARYVRRCGGCHVLREPRRYPAEAWPRLLDQMVTRQKLVLPEDERAAILTFVVAASACPEAPAPQTLPQ